MLPANSGRRARSPHHLGAELVLASRIGEPPPYQRNEIMTTTQPKILVVAERDDRQHVSRALGTESYEILQSDGADGLFQQLDQAIDLVICDLSLRGPNCHELMRRWQERRPTTPFIFLAETEQVADAIQAMKNGAADYVTKPINGDELVVRVVQWLEASRKDERLQQLESRLDRCQSETARNGAEKDASAGTLLEDLERAAVERALEQHRGNRTRAAKSLGISVRTLQRKLKAWHAPVFAWQHHVSRQDFSVPAMR
jgi:DNA-binding NtrC family response regulator